MKPILFFTVLVSVLLLPLSACAGAAPPPVPTPRANAPILPEQVTLDAAGLPYTWQAQLVPPTPYDASQAPGPMGLPEHIEIHFTATGQAPKAATNPILYLIPVKAYQEQWDQAGNPSVSATISRIYSLTVALPTPAPTSGIPALPSEQVSGVNDLAVQVGLVKTEPESASKSGYRFVGRWAQDANPVTNQGLRYVYQGFTNDGKYLVAFFYPVTTTKLPDTTSAADMTKFSADPQSFIQTQAEMLNALAPADWQPDLRQLDQLVASLRVQGMPPTGLLDNAWQWFGSTYNGQDQPVSNPTQYGLIYGQDGWLHVHADCNTVKTTYTYDGGMVGTVRVAPFSQKLAECAAGSRSHEFIKSLEAAQDFRVPPGGAELQLNLPAGGPVLKFSAH